MKAHIITSNQPKHSAVLAHGWGDNAVETVIETSGRVMEISIERNGKRQFGIHIDEDGRLVLTDYDNMNFQTYVPQNLTLYPLHNWK